MKPHSRIASPIILLIFLVAAAAFGAAPTSPGDPLSPASAPSRSQAARAAFSFIHISDTHLDYVPAVPRDPSRMRSVKSFREIGALIDRGGVTSASAATPPPAFILHTGDLTEFGYAGATAGYVESVLSGLHLPIYLTPGNHDGTWTADTNFMRRRFGALNYAFTYGGVRFICLDDATIQDLAPSFGPEALDFVSRELKSLTPADPVVVCFHHPFTSNEFASLFDKSRLLDLLRPYNVIAMLVGHGHRAAAWKAEGLDWIEGGSTFSPKGDTDGFNLITITPTSLEARYHYLHVNRPPTLLLKKAISRRSAYPAITIEAPAAGQAIQFATFNLRAAIASDLRFSSATAVIDDQIRQSLELSGQTASGVINLEGLPNGAHSLRIEFVAGKKESYSRSLAFRLERPAASGQGRALWTAGLDGGIKAAPLLGNGCVYIGSLGGKFYALDEKTGAKRWTFDAGSEILTTAARTPQGRLVFGTGAGDLIVLNPDGKETGRYKNRAAIYGSPVVDEKGIAYAGSNHGEFLAFDTAAGKLLWKKTVAAQAIESALWLAGGRLYADSWDGYIYCVDPNTGGVAWKAPGPYCQKSLNRYYAPADDNPKTAGGKVWVADRAYRLGRYGLDGKYEGDMMRGVAAIGVAPGGQALYLRRLGSGLVKLGLDGKPLWENKDVTLGRIPAAPLEQGGKVYCVSNDGLLSVLDAQAGKVLWKYQVTPKLFVFGGVAVGGDGTVFAAGMDGAISAINEPRP